MLDEWVAHNGCDTEPIVSDFPDQRPTDNRTVTLHAYGNCEPYTRQDGGDGEAAVRFYQVNNGGHQWPRNPTLDTSSEIWNFFSQHSLPLNSITPGDFDENGSLDANDIDLLSQAVGGSEFRYDLNFDGVVSEADRNSWISDSSRTYYGDANLDGLFDSSDLVDVFQRNEYEDGVSLNSGWADGDWNGDQEFDSGDIVLGFQSGGYEAGPRTLIAVVPETSSIALAFIGLLWLIRLRPAA